MSGNEGLKVNIWLTNLFFCKSMSFRRNCTTLSLFKYAEDRSVATFHAADMVFSILR